MELVSEIPMSAADALIVLKALRAHARICDSLSDADALPDERRQALVREAGAARRIASDFTYQAAPVGDRKDN